MTERALAASTTWKGIVQMQGMQSRHHAWSVAAHCEHKVHCMHDVSDVLLLKVHCMHAVSGTTPYHSQETARIPWSQEYLIRLVGSGGTSGAFIYELFESLSSTGKLYSIRPACYQRVFRNCGRRSLGGRSRPQEVDWDIFWRAPCKDKLAPRSLTAMRRNYNTEPRSAAYPAGVPSKKAAVRRKKYSRSRLADWLAVWLAGWLGCWLAGRLAGWLAVWLAVWLIG